MCVSSLWGLRSRSLTEGQTGLWIQWVAQAPQCVGQQWRGSSRACMGNETHTASAIGGNLAGALSCMHCEQLHFNKAAAHFGLEVSGACLGQYSLPSSGGCPVIPLTEHTVFLTVTNFYKETEFSSFDQGSTRSWLLFTTDKLDRHWAADHTPVGHHVSKALLLPFFLGRGALLLITQQKLFPACSSFPLVEQKAISSPECNIRKMYFGAESCM